MLTVFICYESQDAEVEVIAVPMAARSKKERTLRQKHKKIYSGIINFTLNRHLGLISEVARHSLYRVHGVKIGTK